MTDIPPRHRRAVELLADGGPVGDVAGELGISPRTLRRWRSAPEFQAALGEAVAARIDDHRRDVRAMLGEAVATVRARLKNSDPKAAAIAARILGTAHLAAFAGGARPGETRHAVRFASARDALGNIDLDACSDAELDSIERAIVAIEREGRR